MSCPAGKLPSELRRVVVSTNPIAGTRPAARRVERLKELLDQQGFPAEVFTELSLAVERALGWFERGELRALVAVGGDGTVSELVRRTPPTLPVAVLPAGNQNLLARHLGFDHRPEQLCQTIATGGLRRVDAAAANGRTFLLMCGCGFDAEVVWRVHRRRRGHAGNMAYAKPIVQTLCSYPWPVMEICWQDEQGRTGRLEGCWAFAFNLPRYGGGLPLAPWADESDGLLDVCVFARGGLWQSARYLKHVWRRSHRRLDDVTCVRARQVHITARQPLRYQLDGDPGGRVPVEIEILPGRATFLAPTPAVLLPEKQQRGR